MSERQQTADVYSIVEKAAENLGCVALKPKKREAVVEFVNGRDVFVVLPTGYGKSLCYGILPTVFERLRNAAKNEECGSTTIIVISPLVALMKDQVDFFTSKGLKAVKAEGCTKEKYEDIINAKCHLIFISPEAILSQHKWRKLLLLEAYQKNLVALVIDEAHCVRNWYVK